MKGTTALATSTARREAIALLARAESIPGVEGASASFSGVLWGETWRNVIAVEGFVPRAGVTPRSFVNAITPRYLDVMRIAILRGRGFTDRDRETVPKVAIVNETFVRQFFGEADPIGKWVELCPCDSSEMMEIIDRSGVRSGLVPWTSIPRRPGHDRASRHDRYPDGTRSLPSTRAGPVFSIVKRPTPRTVCAHFRWHRCCHASSLDQRSCPCRFFVDSAATC
jgi:hypothetical protein